MIAHLKKPSVELTITAPTPPIVPWALVIDDRLSPYEAPAIERFEVVSETYQQLRLKGRTNAWKNKSYCLPNQAAWEQVQQLHAAFQAALMAMATHLRALGSYATRFREAGGLKKAPNPLTPTIIAADDPDDPRTGDREWWMVPTIERHSVIKHSAQMLRYQLRQYESPSTQRGFFICPDHDAWVKLVDLHTRATETAAVLQAYLKKLATYDVAKFANKYGPEPGDRIITASGQARVSQIEQAGNEAVIHAKYGGNGVDQPHVLEGIGAIEKGEAQVENRLLDQSSSELDLSHEIKQGDYVLIEGCPNKHNNGKFARVVRVNKETFTVLPEGAAQWKEVCIDKQYCRLAAFGGEPQPVVFQVGDTVEVVGVQIHQSRSWIGRIGTIFSVGKVRIRVQLNGNGNRSIELPLPPKCIKRVDPGFTQPQLIGQETETHEQANIDSGQDQDSDQRRDSSAAEAVSSHNASASTGVGDETAVSEGLHPVELDLGLIRTDGGTQPRSQTDWDYVIELANDLQSGIAFKANLPPAVVFFDGTNYWLGDGFHRYYAHKRCDLRSIRAIVHQGTQREAILFSVGANADHGKRRSPNDKRRAVLRLLNDPEWVNWSDREIARRTKTSNTFVSKLRSTLTVNVNSEKEEERTYTTKYGTTATMQTGSIGKATERNVRKDENALTLDELFVLYAQIAEKVEHQPTQKYRNQFMVERSAQPSFTLKFLGRGEAWRLWQSKYNKFPLLPYEQRMAKPGYPLVKAPTEKAPAATPPTDVSVSCLKCQHYEPHAIEAAADEAWCGLKLWAVGLHRVENQAQSCAHWTPDSQEAESITHNPQPERSQISVPDLLEASLQSAREWLDAEDIDTYTTDVSKAILHLGSVPVAVMAITNSNPEELLKIQTLINKQLETQ